MLQVNYSWKKQTFVRSFSPPPFLSYKGLHVQTQKEILLPVSLSFVNLICKLQQNKTLPLLYVCSFQLCVCGGVSVCDCRCPRKSAGKESLGLQFQALVVCPASVLGIQHGPSPREVREREHLTSEPFPQLTLP